MKPRSPLLDVAATEVKIGGRRFAFWFIAFIFALVGVFYFTRFMSVSPGDDSMTQSVKLARNSAFSLAMVMGLCAFVFIHFTAALTVDPVLRDRRIGLLPLVLSSPVGRSTYVMGKFLGALLLALAAPLFFVVAAAIAQFVPNHQVGLIAPNAVGLAVGYLEFYVPLTIFVAGLVFALAIWTESPKFVYSVVTALFIAYFMLLNTIQTVEHRELSYLDPTGLLYLTEIVNKGRTNAEMNAVVWLTHGLFLVNRAVLIALGFGLPALAAVRFARRTARAGDAVKQGRRTRAAAEVDRLLPAAGIAAPLRPLASQIPLRLGGLLQFFRVTGAELRLLTHERSLFFLLPLLAVLLWTSMQTTTGIFDAEPIPISTQVALDMQWLILIFLFGTTIFFGGETAYRDREYAIADLIHSYPVPSSALVAGKIVANLLLALALIGVGVLTGILYQVTHGGGAVRLAPFVALFGGVMLPTVLFLIVLSLAAGYLTRSKIGGYAVVLGLGGLLLWAFFRDHRHWLYNLPGLGLFTYSDVVGFGPLGSTLFLQRLYVLGIAVFLAAVAVAAYPRVAGSWRRARAGASPGRAASSSGRWRGWQPLAAAAIAVTVVLGVVIYRRVEAGMWSLKSEREIARYEREKKPWLARSPEPEIAGVDLELDLHPERHAFDLALVMSVTNTRAMPIDTVHVTVNPRLMARGELTLAGRPPASYDTWVATFPLAAPLAPGDSLNLACRWSGRVPDGVPRRSSMLQTFIVPGGSFLHSLAPQSWLPVLGYNADLELDRDRTRKKYGLSKRESLPDPDSTGTTLGLLNQSLAFPFRARIRVPAGEQALSAGTLVAERDAGPGRREFEYVSDGPIYFYPVMTGRWTKVASQSSAVYHAPQHGQNAQEILDALVASREAFSSLFVAYPYQELRLAEFPRFVSLAMGYPTLIPYSENIGFLTRGTEKRANLNFYVTAHEVAHQWWGTVIWPAHAKGAPVLTEGMANYATLLMAGRHEGEAKRHAMFEDLEDRYLRSRDPNEERPLELLDGDRRRDDVVWYNRGGIVIYMLHDMLGEEAMLAGLKEFIGRFSFQADHPTMGDFMAVYEARHPETRRFFDQYVRGIAIPNPGYRSARREKTADGYRVALEVENRGSGDLDLTIAATRGERGKDAFEERRTRVTLRGTTPVAAEIQCPFEPEHVEMDPDRTALLQERKLGRKAL